MSTTFMVIEWFLLLFWSYWFIISLFGFGKPKRVRNMTPQTRFAVFVPAHNEGAVIDKLINNLLQMEYPHEMYKVYVIADNCDDETAHISRESGATVIEHYSLLDERRGKPHALKYAFSYLGENLYKDYDAIVVFDADNLVSVNYLQTMNNHLAKGDQLVQCYLDSKNPNDNWITLSYALSYYYMNRSWQLAKSRLRLGNAIGGTGFCFTTTLLRNVGWNARSLTEDLEFTMQCLLRGIPATWNHHARVYDEKPTEFKASVIQRLRWARGHWDVAFRYTFRLLWRFVSKLDMRALDGMIYLLNPGKIVLGFVTSIVFYAQFIAHWNLIHVLVPEWAWGGFVTFNLLYVIGSGMADAKQKINIVKSTLSLVVLNITYVPIFVWGFITARNTTWKSTLHMRNLSIQEMSEVNNPST